MEPPPGFEPGSRPYQERALPSELRRHRWGMRIRRGVTSRVRRPSWGTWIRTTTERARADRAANYPIPHQYGRRESNPHEPCGSPGFEPGVAAGLHHARVRRQGLEPIVPRIKSPVHSHTCSQRLEPRRGMEPRSAAWRAAASPQCLPGMTWFPEVSNLAPAELHSAALPDELENHRRGGKNRTPSAWSQARCADHYATPRWTTRDSSRWSKFC
jgi:hypothetical protein